MHSNVCVTLGETSGTDTSPASPLLHFPYSGIFLRLLPKAHCGFVSCHVCEQPKEQRWSENISDEGHTAALSAAPTAVQGLEFNL